MISVPAHACHRYVNAAVANTSLAATLRQLYAQTDGGEPAAGAPGHVMYSDEPPLVDPLGDEDFYAYSATQGRGVLVRGSFLVAEWPAMQLSGLGMQLAMLLSGLPCCWMACHAGSWCWVACHAAPPPAAEWPAMLPCGLPCSVLLS
jgi:hypothetical protein